MSDRFIAARGDSIVINGGPIEVWFHEFSDDRGTPVVDVEVRNANDAQLVKPVDVTFWVSVWVISLCMALVIGYGAGS